MKSSFTFKPAAVGAWLLATALVPGALRAGQSANLGLGLRELSTGYRTNRTAGSKTLTHSQFVSLLASNPHARADANDRVLVDVYLDGSLSMDDAVKAAEALGCTVTARADWYRQGAFSAYLPVNQANTLGRTSGIRTVNLSLKPRHYVGLATSQGTKVLNSVAVNARGFLGAGVTVGALSDSFDTQKFSTTAERTNATQDAANDDLPGVGSASNTTPVNVLQDYGNASAPGTDEGRAMLQIIHDVVPAANLAFATADESEIGFADNIIALAGPTTQTYTVPVSDPTTGTVTGTQTINGAACNVICDDVGYYDEPMFSDGVVAQAIDQVATQNNVSYFSSAGNDGSSGYVATYSPQTNNTTNQGLLASEGGISATVYATIPLAERNAIESFHSFGTNAAGNPILVQKVKQPKTNNSSYSATIIFQWSDPFNVGKVSTDYDILTFSIAANGTVTYQPTLSGTGANGGTGGTDQPIEIPTAALKAGTQYEFVIVRTNRTPNTGVTANQASRIRWVVESDASQVIADFVGPNNVESYGHNCAENCNGTAAYVYDKGFNNADTTYAPEVETYSSNGPSQIYFDNAGNRLATPATRKQPVLSTVDGVDTSFFGGSTTSTATGDSDGDGYPNFFGTSAAAPHGAGCAALLLNAAASKGIFLTPADIRTLLVSTTQGQQDLDPAASNATGGPVKFGAVSRSTYTDPSAFTITFTGTAGTVLTSLVFNLAPISGDFFTSAYPVTSGGSTAPSGTAPTITAKTLSGLVSGSTTTGSTETLTFSNFNPGDTLSFGVATGTAAGSILAADDLAGATFTATVSGTNYTGTLANTFGKKWNVKSGYGLVDVNAAVIRLLGQ